MSFSSATIVGNLGRDAEMRYLPNNATPVVSFSVAVDQGFGDRKQTNWWNITMFGQRAENLVKYLVKGTKVALEGELQLDKWEKDGVKHEKVKIIIDRVSLEGGGSARVEGTATSQKPGQDAFQEAYDAGDEEIIIPVV
jgi:single-strand DNA-binding protein